MSEVAIPLGITRRRLRDAKCTRNLPATEEIATLCARHSTPVRLRSIHALACLCFFFHIPSLAAGEGDTEPMSSHVGYPPQDAVTQSYYACTFANSIGMEFSRIPAGTLLMGSPKEEPGREEDEGQHLVTISEPFYMQVTEVTQGQWQKLLGKDPSYFSDCGDACPVEQVTWSDAVEFCNRLSELEGLRIAYRVLEGFTVWEKEAEGYRLPTEAEWEYACRAGSTSAFYTGGITRIREALDPNLDRAGWYFGNVLGTQPVKGKVCNPWGLYDMHGNVWEWCWDWYGQYDASPVQDPTGPLVGARRVLRGGSWHGDAKNCRSADRVLYAPGGKNYSLGFRVCRSAPR